MQIFSGDKLKHLLDEKGVSQATLAERLDVSPSTVSTWVLQKSQPEPGSLERIAKILEVAEEDLTEEIDSGISNSGNNSTGVCGLSIYGNSPITVNINSDHKVDTLFLDAEVDNGTTIGLKIESAKLAALLQKANAAGKGAGQFLADLIDAGLEG